MTLRLNIKHTSGMIKSSHGQQALPLKPATKVQKFSIRVALKKVDTEGVKKLYLCESVGVPPERRA